MFDAFQQRFTRDHQARPRHAGKAVPDISAVPGLSEFLSTFGGASFCNGLYRTVHPVDVDQWRERVCLAFPDFGSRITCFGYDWLGRCFALDSIRPEDGQQGVVMFEPGTGEALEIPSNIQTFHNVEIIRFCEAALALSFYDKWIAAGGRTPAYVECVGYRRPLFLGGSDDVENLEVADLDAYWHVVGQLVRKTKGLPERTSVRVRME